MRSQTFKGRLTVVVLCLVAVVQAAGFAAVALSVRAGARATVDDELRVAGELLVRQLATRRQPLVPATLDDRTAAELRLATGLHVSFVGTVGRDVTVHGSTLPARARHAMARDAPAVATTRSLDGGGDEHVVRATRLTDNVVLVLQRPLVEALQPWDTLLGVLLAIGAAGVLLALVAALVLARRVSGPVLALARAAERVAAGDVSARVEVRRRDELGRLAATFNDMVAGLRERDRTRRAREHVGRLKRFFSPTLAERLAIGDDSILAPHRSNVTVVFCELRGFSTLAETAEPHEVTRLLGTYHEIVRPLIFDYGGTIERFTGDGLMVIFNDPVPCPAPAAQGVRMAVAMRDAVEPLLETCRRRGDALGFGVGIATGDATLGRIPFVDARFDYAAIGSVTSLTARLCQAARDGQILVSQRVYTEVEDLVHAIAMGPFTTHGLGKPFTVFNIVALRGAEYTGARAG